MLPNDRQLMVVTHGLQADMVMVVVQETIIRRTTEDCLLGEVGVGHAKKTTSGCLGMITLP